MKAITICQPFASAIIKGIKTIENRNWKTHCRGKLTIHAGLSKGWLERVSPAYREVLEPLGEFEKLPFGMIIGVVDLDDCVKFDHKEVIDKPFATGPYCWILKNPREFKKPIPWRGRQGLWNIPEHVSRRFMQLLRGAKWLI